MSDKEYSKVQFHFVTSSFTLRERRKLKIFIDRIFKMHHRKLESIHYIFCSDEYLRTINKNYLQHDYYTDIVTFDLSASKETIGEIYISVDRVKENAKTYKNSFKEELHRVIFHGVLHLCGFKDKTAKEQATMRNQEQTLLNQYFKG